MYLPLFECDKIKKNYIYATFTYEQLAILGTSFGLINLITEHTDLIPIYHLAARNLFHLNHFKSGSQFAVFELCGKSSYCYSQNLNWPSLK